jgi:hypothetical protein
MGLTWKREWTWILIALLSLRLLYSVVGISTISDGLPQALGADEGLFSAIAPLETDQLSQALVNVWMRWDTAWYLKIAASGYSANDASTAFMPLYPWLIKSVGFLLGGNLMLAAILISNLFAILAVILLYELATLETRIKVNATQSVLTLLIFPTGFFLLAAYTESLFLALILASWLFAMHKKWWAAGIMGALATLCRLQGALLSPVLLCLYLADAAGAMGMKPVEQIRLMWHSLTDLSRWRNKGTELLRLNVLAVVLPGASMVAYQTWLKYTNLGDTRQALVSLWGIQTVTPWEGFRLFSERLISTPRVFIDYIDLGMLVFMLVICISGTLKLDPAYSLFNWLSLGLFFMRGTPPHLLDSFSRYLLMLFPAFLLFGTIKNRRLVLILGSLSFILQIFLLVGFLDWRWVA